MTAPSLTCPKCKQTMDHGFSPRTTGFSFIPPEKFLKFAFVSEDLTDIPWSKAVLPSKAEYFRAFVCRPCSFFMVDYQDFFSRQEVEQLLAAKETT